MKATGIVRKVDELGRIVVPIELRRMMNIDVSDPLEVFTEKDLIILRKYEPALTCAITGDISKENVSFADGKIVLSQEGAEELLESLKEEFGL